MRSYNIVAVVLTLANSPFVTPASTSSRLKRLGGEHSALAVFLDLT